MNAWRKALLGSVVTFQRGYDLPYRDRRHGTFPVVTSAGITDFHFKPMVDPPGVVTGRYGTIGGLFFIDQPFWPLNTTLYVRDFHGNDPKFTYFLLQQFDFESFSGKSGVPGVNRNDLHKEPVWIPESVAEQTEIANALSDVELLLNELSLIIEKKRHIKQAAMQELLTGKRRLPGFEGEWEVFSLGSVASMNSGGTPPTGRDNYYGGGIPWVSISDMTSGGKFISETERSLSEAGLTNCSARRFPAGTVLYAT
jgi:type I restriction enzyme S subunit